MFFWFKVLLSALIISFASMLSGRKPDLAGFIMALPISSLIVIALSFFEHRDVQASTEFAKSIFFAVPLSLTFFLPFLVVGKVPLISGFWQAYAAGVILLVGSYFTHQWVVGLLK